MRSTTHLSEISNRDFHRRLKLPVMMNMILAAAVALPAWMSGSWSGAIDNVQMEEHWTAPGGGVMLGMHRDVGKSVEFEFLRIEMQKDGTLVYLAQPFGKPATPFPLKSSTDARVVFENAKHDFPQRIIYWRKDAQLCARVEGTIGGKQESQEWCWTRMK
jgi:hypothetical protein